nr:VOC family protein [Hamadaea tsunoensis]
MHILPERIRRTGCHHWHIEITGTGRYTRRRCPLEGRPGRLFEADQPVARRATRLWEGRQGPHTWVTMADPEGNEFCVARPGTGRPAGGGNTPSAGRWISGAGRVAPGRESPVSGPVPAPPGGASARRPGC